MNIRTGGFILMLCDDNTESPQYRGL